ncbi:DNA polymerase/3'-5' exonuclease PolX [Candidatus Woesebacteria bacterium]|nr:DNA polymerase/3'-5' exonuclease PolX [Candidatus Woesebacteria bacterium]
MSTIEKYTNKSIAELLRNIAAAYLLKFESERNIRFKIIAYEKAADAIEHLSREIRDIWQEGKLLKVPGVGPGIGTALNEYFEKGQSQHFNEVLKGVPPSVFILMKVPGIGPKKAFRLVTHFGFTMAETIVSDVRNAAQSDKISELEGFGKKSQADILEALQLFERQDRREERMPMPYAFEIAAEVEEYLRQLPEIQQIDALGSLRRRVSTIGDIDIAVMANNEDSKKIVDHFLAYPGKRSVEGAGDKKASILAAGNIRIDLRVQDKETYGSMLQYFTGSKAHNIQLREYALKKGLSLSEYGIVKKTTPPQSPSLSKRGKGELKPYEDPTLEVFETEEAFYGHLGLPYIPPEMREGTTEIQIAIKNKIPELIELKDIKGDFHTHTSYDIKTSHDVGLNTVQELVEKAKKLDYSYMGFSDHNPKISGLSANEATLILKERKQHFDQVLSHSGIPHFIGLEVDIMPSGELAFPEDALAYVDYLIVSLHSSLRMDIDTMTERVLKALSYPKVKIFGHPTGRLLSKREGADIRWEKVIPYVVERNIALEINASPQRLDLPDVLVREAKDQGAKFFINTDAHAVEHMDFMKYGIYVARRGWLTKSDVINTGSAEDIMKWFAL